MTALATRSIVDVDDPRHGTLTGYKAHMRAGDAPCGDCKTAQADYTADYRAGGSAGAVAAAEAEQASHRETRAQYVATLVDTFGLTLTPTRIPGHATGSDATMTVCGCGWTSSADARRADLAKHLASAARKVGLA